jgi:PAS domain S-box-containing protein
MDVQWLLTDRAIAVEVSCAVERVLGHSRHEALAFGFLGLVHPDDKPGVATLLHSVVCDGREQPRDFSCRARGRGGIWLHTEGLIWNRLCDPAIRALVVCQRDVSELVRAKEARVRARGLLERAEQIGRMGTWRSSGNELYWSPNAYRIFGVKDGVQVDVPFFYSMVHPDDRERVQRAVQRSLASGNHYAIEHRVLRADGVVRWIKERADVVDDGNGKLSLVGVAQDVTERREVEREKESFFDLCQDVVVVIGFDGHARGVNDAWSGVLGWTKQEFLSQPIASFVHPEDMSYTVEQLGVAARTTRAVFFENRVMTKCGGARRMEWSVTADPHRKVIYGLGRDVTERRRLEEQLLRARKMEAVGRLAGGIAHDFNNMLMVILGSANLALDTLSENHPTRVELERIVRAAERSADLTRRLLVFGRRQNLEPGELDVFNHCNEMAPMLSRLLGDAVHLHIIRPVECCRVRVNRAQMEQVIVNLVLNARDAMPDGGTITLEVVRTAVLDHGGGGSATIAPGRYVVLTVSDTGQGMSAGVQAHLFEPFFTTKEAGRGVGLGLATAFGVVKASGGHLEVESTQGCGSTFKMWFPAADSGPVPSTMVDECV